MLEKLKEHYDIWEEDGILYSRLKGSSMKNTISKTEKVIYFLCGNSASSQEEAEKLVQDGKGYKVTGAEIYREFYNWNDNEYCLQIYGYDLRTKNYFDAIRKGIGFVREDHGWEEDKLKNSFIVNVWPNSSKVEIGKTKEGLWCSQFCVSMLDDYDIIKYYFNKKPTINDIKTAKLIADIEFFFWSRWLKPEFTCWECGIKHHWLDIPGPLPKKYENLKEKYCGC